MVESCENVSRDASTGDNRIYCVYNHNCLMKVNRSRRKPSRAEPSLNTNQSDLGPPFVKNAKRITRKLLASVQLHDFDIVIFSAALRFVRLCAQ